MTSKVIISLKSDGRSSTETFEPLMYSMDEITMSHDCERLKAMVDQAKKNFGEDPAEIKIKAVMEW